MVPLKGQGCIAEWLDVGDLQIRKSNRVDI